MRRLPAARARRIDLLGKGTSARDVAELVAHPGDVVHRDEHAVVVAEIPVLLERSFEEPLCALEVPLGGVDVAEHPRGRSLPPTGRR